MSERELLELVKKIDDIKDEFFSLMEEFKILPAIIDMYKEYYKRVHELETPLEKKLAIIYDILSFYHEMKLHKI